MKKILLASFISIFLNACGTDNFYDTDREITLDRNAYMVGDTIHAKLKISPVSVKEKSIKVYDNYKNIEVSFSLVDEIENIYNGDWTKPSSEFLRESSIKEIVITKQAPFTLELAGAIYTDEEFLYLYFPKINYKARFLKSQIKNTTLIRMHGRSIPIKPELGASLNEYFTVKDFKIIM